MVAENEVATEVCAERLEAYRPLQNGLAFGRLFLDLEELLTHRLEVSHSRLDITTVALPDLSFLLQLCFEFSGGGLFTEPVSLLEAFENALLVEL
jgi:hypothetical protein